MSKLAFAPNALSPRESELARLVATGYSNGEIAAMLSIRRQTVKNHVAAIFRKLSVNNRVQLTLALATKLGQELRFPDSAFAATIPSSPPTDEARLD